MFPTGLDGQWKLKSSISDDSATAWSVLIGTRVGEQSDKLAVFDSANLLRAKGIAMIRFIEIGSLLIESGL